MANLAPVIREGTFIPLENATRGKKKEEREQYSEWTTIQQVENTTASGQNKVYKKYKSVQRDKRVKDQRR